MENLPETSVSFYVLLHLMVTTCKNHGFLQSFPQTNPLIVTSSHCAGSNLHASNARCWHSFSACSGGSCWLIWSDCDEDSSDCNMWLMCYLMWLNKMVVMVNMVTMNNHIVFIWSNDSNHGIFWQSPMVTMVTIRTSWASWGGIHPEPFARFEGPDQWTHCHRSSGLQDSPLSTCSPSPHSKETLHIRYIQDLTWI
jgi:hypothetical protein